MIQEESGNTSALNIKTPHLGASLSTLQYTDNSMNASCLILIMVDIINGM